MKEEKPKQDAVDNKLELVKYTAQVQSRIKTDITSDFVLAKLNEKEKEAIVEMTSNAYFTKRVIQNIAKRAKTRTWNSKNKNWTIKPLNPKSKEYQTIIQQSQITFDAFMNRMMMTVLLNRNVDKNYILNILAQKHDEDELINPEEKITLAKQPKEAIKNEEQGQIR